MKYKRKIRRLPTSYWWKFKGGYPECMPHIEIQSDHPDFPIVETIMIAGHYSDRETEMAERIIADLEAGRISLKKLKEKERKSK